MAGNRGEIEKLKANYRRTLARDGYALVKCEGAVFKPEARPKRPRRELRATAGAPGLHPCGRTSPTEKVDPRQHKK